MNTVTNDTQHAKKNFTPNVGSANLSQDDGLDTESESARAEKRSTSQSQSQSGSAKVTSLRESGSTKAKETSSKESEGKQTSPTQKEQPQKEQAQKEPTLVDNLDLALMNASISIGDWVKKIEALSPKEGAIARASQFTVSKLQGIQNYMGDNSTKEIAESAWRFVRRSPLPVGLAIAGAGVGIYLTRNSGSKASSTQESKAE